MADTRYLQPVTEGLVVGRTDWSEGGVRNHCNERCDNEVEERGFLARYILYCIRWLLNKMLLVLHRFLWTANLTLHPPPSLLPSHMLSLFLFTPLFHFAFFLSMPVFSLSFLFLYSLFLFVSFSIYRLLVFLTVSGYLSLTPTRWRERARTYICPTFVTVLLYQLCHMTGRRKSSFSLFVNFLFF